MSEQPGILFSALVAIAATLSTLLFLGLVALGAGSLASILVTLLGAFSACVFFLVQLRAVPLTSLALVALTSLSAVGLLRALVRFRRQQKLLRALPLERIEAGELIRLAHAAGAGDLYLARASRSAAFCVGLLHPRLVVTSGLLDRLTPEEQAAVIWHETQHARLREPLRCLVADTLTAAFFWLPALCDLRERYRLARELDADQVAIAHTSRRALAGALHEVIAEPPYFGTVGLADAAAARIDRLFDPTAHLPPLFHRARLIVSAASIGALALLVAVPAQLSLGEHKQLDTMLTSSSLHGLPGMTLGFVVNTALIAGIALTARRVSERRIRSRDPDRDAEVRV
jgi:hypothetical protein